MKLTISFKHLEHTQALDERIHEKSQKLNKFFDGRLDCKWTCYVHQNFHICEIKLIGPHFEYHATAKSENMYKSIDDALAKIERQIEKKKSKLRNKISRENAVRIKNWNLKEIEKDEELAVMSSYKDVA